jgi:hypothetical protein
MSSPSSAEAESPAFQPFTKAERIQQLNDIDKVSATLAALATKYLIFSRA